MDAEGPAPSSARAMGVADNGRRGLRAYGQAQTRRGDILGNRKLFC